MVRSSSERNQSSLPFELTVTFFLGLLPKHTEFIKWFTSFTIFFTGIDKNIFTILCAVCWEQANNAFQIHAFVGNDLLHQHLGIIEQLLCFGTNSLIVKDFGIATIWITASEFPCLEERVLFELK